MPFNLELDDIVFHDEPEFISGIPRSQTLLNSQLQSGLWLVMNVATYSGPDIQNITEVVAAIKAFSGRVKLAVRTVDDVVDIQSWCSNVKEKYQSPVLLFFADGSFVASLVGAGNRDILTNKLETTFGISREARKP
jgi:hypothetical protein